MAGLSRHNSGLTNDDSTGFVEQEETSSLDSFEWTDEKHSLYLKSMEASFVNQLYNSKDLFSWCPVRQHGLDVKLCRQGNPPGSDQVKVQQHGYWKKIFYRTVSQPEEGGGYGTFLANPWIKYFAAGERPEVAADNDAFEQPLSSGGQMLSSCGSGNISRLFTDGEHHQVSINFNEEFSDQNFVNEDRGNRAANGQRRKRLRTKDASTSISDQVVPFGTSHRPMHDPNEGCSGSQDRVMERGGRATETESAF